MALTVPPTVTLGTLITQELYNRAHPGYGQLDPDQYLTDLPDDEKYMHLLSWPSTDFYPKQLVIAYSDDPDTPSVRARREPGDLRRCSYEEQIEIQNSILVYIGDQSDEALTYTNQAAHAIFYQFDSKLMADRKLKTTEFPKGLAMQAWVSDYQVSLGKIEKGSVTRIDFAVTVLTNTLHLENDDG